MTLGALSRTMSVAFRLSSASSFILTNLQSCRRTLTFSKTVVLLPCSRMSLSTAAAAAAAAAAGHDILASFGDRGREFHGDNISAAMHYFANADAVCFDVDSTVIQEEGIDVLAASVGKGDEVSAWTRKAMEGNIKFEDALAARLAIIQPSRDAITACLTNHPFRLSPGIDRLIETLNENGTDVFLVSGGFRMMIEPIAKTLCVAKSNIVANTIFFNDEGNYSGFDRNEPTSKDMGKPKAIQQIKDQYGYQTIVMVGDGATDAQAKPPADAFIGFGGVIVREAVKKKACWYVMDFDVMIEVLQKFGRRKLN